MKTKLLLFLLILSTVCQSQISDPLLRKYYYHSKKLEFFLYQRNPDSALFYAKKLSESNLLVNTYSYTNISKAFYLNNKQAIGEYWLLKSIVNEGFNSKGNLEYNINAYKNVIGERYEWLLEKYDSLSSQDTEAKKKYKYDQIAIIDRIFTEDQQDREEADITFDTTNYLVKKMRQNDIRHFQILDSLFKADEAFPNLVDLDYQSRSHIFLMFIHLFQYFDMESIFARFDEQIAKGLLPSYYSPLLQDKILSYEGKPAKYGMFINSRDQSQYKQIENVTIVDSLRANYCLPPLYIDAIMRGVELPSGYTYIDKSW